MTQDSRTHTLFIEDEVQADDAIAFLARCKEGPELMLAMTLRDCPKRLQVVLAGNTIPPSIILNELAKLTTLSNAEKSCVLTNFS